jgi:hypothetical protein
LQAKKDALPALGGKSIKEEAEDISREREQLLAEEQDIEEKKGWYDENTGIYRGLDKDGSRWKNVVARENELLARKKALEKREADLEDARKAGLGKYRQHKLAAQKSRDAYDDNIDKIIAKAA